MRLQIDSKRLCPSAADIFDAGNVRLGSGCITAAYPAFELSERSLVQNRVPQAGNSAIAGWFPSLQLPEAEITDPGTVRFGSGCITGEFQPR